MGGISEENRRRIASALCLGGLALILVGVSLVLQEQYAPAKAKVQGAEPGRFTNLALAEKIQQVLFWVLMLAGIFGLSTFAFLRWSRQYRKWLLRRPRPPTVVEDVWAMHRLPEEEPWPDDDQAPPPDQGENGAPPG